MPKPVSSIRNLGPAMQTALVRAGVPDAETLHALGADAAYAKLLATGTRPHFIAYYALVMALQGRPWNDCRGAEKDALRARFDALKADATARPGGIDAVLDAVGVVPGGTGGAP